MKAATSLRNTDFPEKSDFPARNDDDEGMPTLRFRAIFISDVHLGTPGCQATQLLDFLRHTESRDLYLVWTYAWLRRPLFLYVGRIAVEKNLPAFLELDLPGTKLVPSGSCWPRPWRAAPRSPPSRCAVPSTS